MSAFLGFCLVAGAQAQPAPLVGVAATPPQRSTAEIVVPLCAELAPTGPHLINAARSDLRQRCTELINDANPASGGSVGDVRAGLQAMAPEEVATQGTSSVEASLRNIGARLAALRGSVLGVGLRRFTLQRHEPALPGTLVASLLPVAASGTAEAPGSSSSSFPRLGVFVNGNLATGEKDPTSRESGFDFDILGVTGGVDYRFTTNLIAGLAFSYISTDVDLDAGGGSLDADGYTVSLYGTYYVADHFYVDGIASVGWNTYNINRRIRYNIRERLVDATLTGGTALVDQTAQGDTDGTQYAFSVGGGYDFNYRALTVGPLLRVNYIRLEIDGYRESIANTRPGFGLALAFADQDVDSLTTVLGAQASYAISTGLGVVLPQVRVEWEHEFLNDARTIRANFVNDPTPDAQTAIHLQTDAPDRDFFNLGVGLSAVFRHGISAFVYYETLLGMEDVTRHTVALGVRLEL